MKALHENCKKLDFTGLISVNGGYNTYAGSSVRGSYVNGIPVDSSASETTKSGGGYARMGFPGEICGYSFTHNPELAPLYAAIREAYAAYVQSSATGIGFQENYSILCGLVSRKY